MAPHPEDLEGRARQAADQLRQASAVQPPHFSDVLSLARAGRVVSAVFLVAVVAFLAGVAFAWASVVGPLALDWLVGGIVVALVVATAAVSAHAGGHAWFVPLPAAALAIAWLVSISEGDRRAGTWWLLAGSAALSAVAVVFAAGILRARAASRLIPAATLVGADGVAVSALDPVGIARVRGETWTAESISGALAPGTPVHVVRADGLRLLVWSEQGQVPGAESLPGRADNQQERS
jgi:membrane-bound ClpP family serine protease